MLLDNLARCGCLPLITTLPHNPSRFTCELSSFSASSLPTCLTLTCTRCWPPLSYLLNILRLIRGHRILHVAKSTNLDLDLVARTCTIWSAPASFVQHRHYPSERSHCQLCKHSCCFSRASDGLHRRCAINPSTFGLTPQNLRPWFALSTHLVHCIFRVFDVPSCFRTSSAHNLPALETFDISHPHCWSDRCST
jgi:hypothetical protein